MFGEVGNIGKMHVNVIYRDSSCRVMKDIWVVNNPVQDTGESE